MYIPKHFQQHHRKKLKDLLRQYPFATLITYVNEEVEAHHLPMVLTCRAGKDVLQGHIAKANSLWQNLPNNSTVLLVFNGPNVYISPSAYPSKAVTGKAVPTWNYVTVHVKGRLTYIDEPAWLLNMMNRLTHQHEVQQAEPWSMNDAPKEYITGMLQAVVGIEITVESLIGKWKISQNQSEENQQGLLTALAKSHDSYAPAMIELIQDNLNESG